MYKEGKSKEEILRQSGGGRVCVVVMKEATLPEIDTDSKVSDFRHDVD